MVRHKIKFPLYLTTFGRTNLILDGLVSTYMPEQTTIDIVGEELKRYAIRLTVQNLAEIDWLKAAYVVTEKAKQVPDIVGLFVEDPLRFISDISRAVQGRV